MTLPVSRDPVFPTLLFPALFGIFLAASPPAVTAEEIAVRVATYNIRYLSTEIPPGRLRSLRNVVSELDADVIGLQEIDDRAALQQVFEPDAWDIVIDDDSTDRQDLAVVVRHPFRVVGLGAELDADYRDFAFPARNNGDFFPNRRDVLQVRVALPDPLEGRELWVLVHHAKARSGGRVKTEPRRVGASKALVEHIRRHLRGQDFVLLGDFNDTPDDRSLNILETGDPEARFEREETPGPFLVNLTEPLYARGHVSYGRNEGDLGFFGRIDTRDPRSRRRNDETRRSGRRSGDALFDQILVPPALAERAVRGSALVFDGASAVRGEYETRASDHLPVYADLLLRR